MADVATTSGADHEVMASVDEGPSGECLVIADLSRDDAWISIPVDAALAVADYR
ncbi:MAG: hypothetical protein ABEJ61_08465 [Haloferacaceae archaeon]